MVVATSPAVIPPPDLVRYADARGAEAADRVGRFLAGQGLSPTAGAGLAVPAWVLLDLAAVLQLREWERAGLGVHREAGLPAFVDACEDFAATLRAVAADPATLLGPNGRWHAVVSRICVGRLAWAGPAALGADVILGETDEDALLDALAALLWAGRERKAS